ncbi:MAG: amidinotransferase [Myxococcota bacterium]|nr:amidinotransferase [Myxococcota bacterium]
MNTPPLEHDVSGVPVNSHNEWDPLEEVVVGRLEGAVIPPNHPAVTFNVPSAVAKIYRFVGGFRYPRLLTAPAQRELDEFIRVLELEGIRVRRPEIVNFARRFRSPDWSSSGFTTACPRDGFLVVGDEIIETPMCWRARYFEALAYRKLFREYFDRGARWTAAPRPALDDSLFDADYRPPEPGGSVRYVITNDEVVFDAADFVRCGRDLFVTRSNVTNESGIRWLRRHLGDAYTIHEIESRCRQPMHIDSSFMPLAPGKLQVNTEYIDVDRLPPVLKRWDLLIAPRPDPGRGVVASMCSDWISLNVLMLDEERVICEKSQPSMQRALRDWGFQPIPVAFLHYAPFGGSFHCATLDVRRRGVLASYF